MASWQTHAVCVYLRATRKKRYRTTEAGLRSMAHGLPAAPLPDELRDRIVGRAARRRRGGHRAARPPVSCAGAGALVYLHGGAFVNGIQPQHWSLVGHLADTTHREVHVARYPLAPGARRHATREAFLDGPARAARPGRRRCTCSATPRAAPWPCCWPRRTPATARIAGLTLIAPWLDLSMTNPAIDLVEPHDPWLTRAGMRPIAAHWVAGRDLTDPTREPAVRRPDPAAAHARARRVARHLPARLRPAASSWRRPRPT